MGSRSRRSEPPSLTRRLRNYIFFTDRSIDNATFADPIIAAGFTLHRFPFRQNTSDPKWIKHCAERGWIGVSADRKISKKPHEIDAVMMGGAALFVLRTGKHTNHQILSENFLRTASKIVEFFETHEAPYIASVTRPNAKDWEKGKPGGVRMWRSYEDWRSHRHHR